MYISSTVSFFSISEHAMEMRFCIVSAIGMPRIQLYLKDFLIYSKIGKEKNINPV